MAKFKYCNKEISEEVADQTGIVETIIVSEKSISDLPKATVKSLRKGLSQKGTIDRGSFSKYIK